ncbi:MAG: DUF3440 domain-containing protein [Prevotellaceae bacterium]|nr:DUF3440 domain-containing protein [Prevotellaceae bacterium]
MYFLLSTLLEEIKHSCFSKLETSVKFWQVGVRY